MTDRIEKAAEHTLLTRRAFTLDAALAILAGCVITISDTACGGDSPAPMPSPSDVNGNVSANHGHVATITGAQITTGSAVSLNIQGTATHPHTVSVSQSQLSALSNRQSVTITSSTDNGHTHDVTFAPA
jgi:hypothetical protein